MNEKVTKFSLKRRKQLEHTIFTDGKLYDVYRNEDPRNCDRWRFFIIDDNYTKHHFNMLDGQINNATSQIVADYWEVVRTTDGGTTMETKDFTGLKVGDKLTRKGVKWDWWIEGKEYEVLKNDTGRYTHCSFYIIDEEQDRRWFNVDQNGKLTNEDVQDGFIWNKPNDGGKTMDNEHGFKVGDKVKIVGNTSAIKDKDENEFNKGDITYVSALHSYDQVRIGNMGYANIINVSKLKHVEDPILKDGMTLVCTKEDKGYANFTEGKEYPVTLDGNGDPCINSDGDTPYYDWEFEKLNGWGIEFTTKTVLSVPESDPLDDSTRSITVEGKSLGELYTNLRNAARSVKALENKKISFDSATDDLTDALVAYKKLGGK